MQILSPWRSSMLVISQPQTSNMALGSKEERRGHPVHHGELNRSCCVPGPWVTTRSVIGPPDSGADGPGFLQDVDRGPYPESVEGWVCSGMEEEGRERVPLRTFKNALLASTESSSLVNLLKSAPGSCSARSVSARYLLDSSRGRPWPWTSRRCC